MMMNTQHLHAAKETEMKATFLGAFLEPDGILVTHPSSALSQD
jgi:hypothetical protein